MNTRYNVTKVPHEARIAQELLITVKKGVIITFF
jgi:hypothetical protein